jgi:hypothetical protein
LPGIARKGRRGRRKRAKKKRREGEGKYNSREIS